MYQVMTILSRRSKVIWIFLVSKKVRSCLILMTSISTISPITSGNAQTINTPILIIPSPSDPLTKSAKLNVEKLMTTWKFPLGPLSSIFLCGDVNSKSWNITPMKPSPSRSTTWWQTGRASRSHFQLTNQTKYYSKS